MSLGCDFVKGNGAMVIVVPQDLPHAENYTVSATMSEISIKAGWDVVAKYSYNDASAFKTLTQLSQIGVVAYKPGAVFPNHITHVAYVETMNAPSPYTLRPA